MRIALAALATIALVASSSERAAAAESAGSAERGAAPSRARRTLLIEPALGVGTPLGWAGASVVVQPIRALALHGGAGFGSQGPQIAAGLRWRLVTGDASLLSLGAGWSTGEFVAVHVAPLPANRPTPPVWVWDRAHLVNLDASLEDDVGWGVVRLFAGFGYVVNEASVLANYPPGLESSPGLFVRFVPYLGAALAFGIF